ncbi:MAG: hypothetical protein K8T10_06650 [Candidatus Eremiobacteraeota bacterium]|nr:hypothetical protein [Candidatus Eremiobacteraeota bacterium]
MNEFVNKIICDNNFLLIKKIPDRSVNWIINSPPYYERRDYGGGTGNEDSSK